LSPGYSGDNDADREEAVSRNRCSEIKRSKRGRGERARQKEAGKKREKNQREKALNTGNLLSPK